jgi:ribokinase
MSQVHAIGSLNLDYVYKVPHFLRPGETLEAAHRAVHWGGKGLNQTVAMLRSGLSVRHCGAVGADGTPLSDFLAAEGSDVSHLRVDERSATGHTFIQVTPDGENAILYYPGTNHGVREELVDDFLSTALEGDFLVLQNEVNGTERLIHEGKRRGLRVVFNPSPFSPELCVLDLSGLYALVLNETEAAEWTGAELAPEDAAKALADKGVAVVILTLGAKGLVWRTKEGESGSVPAFRVEAVDTTGAGDTLAGYAVGALGAYAETGKTAALVEGLRTAAAAAALSVTKEGAVPSIPKRSDVESFLAEHSA